MKDYNRNGEEMAWEENKVEEERKIEYDDSEEEIHSLRENDY
jgi:hypothetical protein